MKVISRNGTDDHVVCKSQEPLSFGRSEAKHRDGRTLIEFLASNQRS